MTNKTPDTPVVEIDDTNIVALTKATLASIPEPPEPDTEFDMFAAVGIAPPD